MKSQNVRQPFFRFMFNTRVIKWKTKISLKPVDIFNNKLKNKKKCGFNIYVRCAHHKHFEPLEPWENITWSNWQKKKKKNIRTATTTLNWDRLRMLLTKMNGKRRMTMKPFRFIFRYEQDNIHTKAIAIDEGGKNRRKKNTNLLKHLKRSHCISLRKVLFNLQIVRLLFTKLFFDYGMEFTLISSCLKHWTLKSEWEMIEIILIRCN